MPASLGKQFDSKVRGGRHEVIRRCWADGWNHVMIELGVKDDRSFRKFLEKNGAGGCPFVGSDQPREQSPPVKVDANYIEARTKELIGELEIEILRLKGELKAKEQLEELYRRQKDLRVPEDLLRVEQITI